MTFRHGRSMIDHIFTVKEILGRAWEHNISVHSIFINLKQAYDSIMTGYALSNNERIANSFQINKTCKRHNRRH